MNRVWRATVDTMSTDRGRWIVIFTVLIGIQAFIGNASTALWDQDESAYAGFAQEMVRTGDWVVPHFIWSEVHRKPPLLLWGIAAGFKLFGQSEFLVRLPALIATCGTFLAVLWFARPLVGGRAARLASMVLGASLLFPNLSKVASPDALVLFADTLVALGLWRYLNDRRGRWLLLFGAGLALGLLAKGPPTLILALGLLLWTTARSRGSVPVAAWLMVPVAAIPFAIWAVLAWRRTNGELLTWMWQWYIERRATGGTVFGQIGYPGYHLIVMMVALLPWSVLVPVALARWRERWADPQLHFLLGWLIFGWIVWELPLSKLPAYAVGGYPAMALLAGRELDDLNPSDGRRPGLTLGIWATSILTGAFVVGLVYFSWRLFGVEMAVFAVLPSLLLIGGLSEGIRGILRGDSRSASKAFATGSLLCVLLIWTGIVPAGEMKRGIGRSVARGANSLDPSGSLPIVYGRNFKMPSIPFYVGQRHPEQLTMASDAELQKRFDPCQPGVYVLTPEQEALTGGSSGVRTVDGWSMDRFKPMRLRVQLSTCQR